MVRVVVADINLPGAEEAASLITRDGSPGLAVRVDVASWASVDNAERVLSGHWSALEDSTQVPWIDVTEGLTNLTISFHQLRQAALHIQHVELHFLV